jgi:anti-sigma factor RsiW
MMCDEMRGKLDLYVDSAGSSDELANFEVHLRGCPACAADAINRLQMKRLTRAASARYTPSPEFRLKVEKSIHSKRPPSWTFGWLPRLAVAAVALLLLVVGLSVWLRHSEREQAFAELVDLHVATLASANPVDVISTDRHTVKPWFQGKLPFTFNLPELQSSSFKLLGGRVAYFEHNPSAQLIFQIRNHDLSVFILQDHPGMIPLTMGTSSDREMEFNVETWTESGLRYVVVGDASPPDIHALGDLLRNAR